MGRTDGLSKNVCKSAPDCLCRRGHVMHDAKVCKISTSFFDARFCALCGTASASFYDVLLGVPTTKRFDCASLRHS